MPWEVADNLSDQIIDLTSKAVTSGQVIEVLAGQLLALKAFESVMPSRSVWPKSLIDLYDAVDQALGEILKGRKIDA